MRNLFLVALLVLVGCGETKTVEKEVIKEVEKEVEVIVDETKTVVSMKAYGEHVLVTYDDGSNTWAHPESFNPITDMDAHKAVADDYISRYGTANLRMGSRTLTIEKYDTLMGQGWVIIKDVYTPYDGSTPTTKFRGLNLGRIDIETREPIWVEGEFEFEEVTNLFKIDDGVFAIDTSDNHNIVGHYEGAGETGSVILWDQLTNLNDPIKLLVQKYLPNGAAPSNEFTTSDFGVDNLTGEDFYFSEDQDSKKDLETIAQAIETEELTQYGLSTKTAKLVKTLANTAGKRALTAREKDMFSKELLGLSFEKAAEMMVEDYEGLIEKAAELNEISPEAIKELINTIM